MYKYLLYLLTILFSLSAYSQDNYTEFIVNGKYGVVNIQTLEEKAAPIYKREISFFDNFLTLEKDSVLDLYNKTTGEFKQFLMGEPRYYVSLDLIDFLHIVTAQHKSALVTKKMKVSFTLPQRYLSIKSFPFSFFLIAKTMNGYDIYDMEKSMNLPFLQIKSGSYFIAGLEDKQGVKANFIVFFGKGEVSIYTKKFQLLKTVRSDAVTANDAVEALKPYFTTDYFEDKDAPRIVVGSANSRPDWELVNDDGGFNTYIHEKYPQIQLKVKSQFGIRDAGYVTVFNSDGSGQYSFKLDRTSKKALIPLKYQQLMGLEIIER